MSVSTLKHGSVKGLVVVAALLLVGLTACDPGVQQAPNSAGSPTPTPTATAAPQLLPNGSAQDNLPFFDSVNKNLIATNPQADGVAFTSALRTAGFSIADMQVTVDITTVGVKADSVQFSVLWKKECLIGQYGFGEYHSVVAPVLGTGKCMVGNTRTIDW